MKVKLKSSAASKNPDLTAGNIYAVIGIEADDFRIMNDHGRPYLYPHKMFTIVDQSPGALWQETKGDDGERYAYPKALSRPGFFEDYFDGNRAAIATLQTYLLKSITALGPHRSSEKSQGMRRVYHKSSLRQTNTR